MDTPPSQDLPPTYECFEICRHETSGEVRTRGCGRRHRVPQAAAKHGKSQFYPYLSSNQPFYQVALEVRDAEGRVALRFTRQCKWGKSSYARWVPAREAAPISSS